MGFDPDSIKPRTVSYDKVPVDAPRDERVNALAHILHSRGVTASLADARRLAEGMVEGERKVLKDGQPKKDPDEERRKIQSSSTFFAGAGVPQTSPHTMQWAPDFRAFVDRSASIGKTAAPSGQTTVRKEEPVAYGRGEEHHTLASVPHVVHSKQVFFDDAPTLDQTRGFSGQTEHKPKFDPFTYGKNQVGRATHSVETVSAVRVEEDGENRIVRTEITSPTTEIIQEEGVIEIDEEKIESILTPDTSVPSAPEAPVVEIENTATEETTASTPTLVEKEPEPEQTVQESFSVQESAPDATPEAEATPEETPAPTATAPPAPEPQREDLAKKHGIDLFSMFKVNK